MMQAIVLRFHSAEIEPGERKLIAEAIDLSTHEPVAAYSLQMMHAWLMRHGYKHRPGSSGIWERKAA